MADNWSAGLTDQDEMSQFPSAVNPLASLGIDPDMVRADPGMLARLSAVGRPEAPEDKTPAAIPGPVSMPGSTPETTPESTPESASAASAGKTGGAGDAAQPPPTDATGYGMEGLGLLSRNAAAATKATGEIPTTNPDIEKLSATREKLATPAPLYDPQTGRKLAQTQEYDPATGQMTTINAKPGVGTRIWRGVRGGLTGLLTSGIRGGLLGAISPEAEGSQAYGAPSSAYQHAEERRGEQLAATDSSLDTAFKSWKDQVDAAKAKSGDLRADATLGKDLTTGATGILNAETEAKKVGNETTRLNNETPEAKAKAAAALTQQQMDERTRDLASRPEFRRATPLQKMLYMANGRMPEPQQTTEGDITAANMARALVTFRAQHNGKDPQTLDDLNQVNQAARGELGKGKSSGPTPEQQRAILDRKNTAIEKAKAGYAKNFNLKEYSSALQQAQDDFEADASTVGAAGPHNVVQVDAKGNVTWVPQAAPAAAPVTANSGPVPRAQAQAALGNGVLHQVKSKADNKLHWTNAQGSVDLGPAE